MDDIEELENNIEKVTAALALLKDAIHLSGGCWEQAQTLDEMVQECMTGPNAKLDQLASDKRVQNENEMISDYYASR